MIATLLGLAGYLLYIALMMGLALVSRASISAFPTLDEKKYEPLFVWIMFALPFVLKDTLYLALISGFPSTLPSSASEMIATLADLAGYLVYITCMMLLVMYVVYTVCVEPLWPDPKKRPDWLWFVSVGISFSLMDMLIKHFSVAAMTAMLLGLAGNLVRMTTTPLLALMALSFFMVLSFLAVMGICAWVAILLPSATNSYPRLMFASIVGITFMVMKNMCELGTPIDQSVLASGSFSTLPPIFTHIKATLVGLAIFINGYRVAHLVMRYVTLLSLAFLPLASMSMTTCAKYTKAAVIITLAVVLTMQPSGMPIESPTLIFQSPSRAGVSNLRLDDFIGVAEQVSVEHKMVIEMIVSGFNMIIEESKRAVQSFVVHTILILMTLICGIMFFVLNMYRVCMRTLTEKSKELVEDRVPALVHTLGEKSNALVDNAFEKSNALVDNAFEKSNALMENAASHVDILIQDQKYRFSFGLLGKKKPEKTPRVDSNTPKRLCM